jgi:sigma-B regulation protein RsbU (phosphoserine phosphatase)
VGIIPGSKFEVKQVQVESGDTLIGYTDGVTEALSPQSVLFSSERFFKILEKPAATASGLIEQITINLFNHIDDASQFDDITMIAVHRKIN